MKMITQKTTSKTPVMMRIEIRIEMILLLLLRQRGNMGLMGLGVVVVVVDKLLGEESRRLILIVLVGMGLLRLGARLRFLHR